MAELADGRVVSASRDGTLRLWDLVAGAAVATLEGGTNEVTAVAALADGRVVSASSDRTLRVWDPADGDPLANLEGHTGGWAVDDVKADYGEDLIAQPFHNDVPDRFRVLIPEPPLRRSTTWATCRAPGLRTPGRSPVPLEDDQPKMKAVTRSVKSRPRSPEAGLGSGLNDPLQALTE